MICVVQMRPTAIGGRDIREGVVAGGPETFANPHNRAHAGGTVGVGAPFPRSGAVAYPNGIE